MTPEDEKLLQDALAESQPVQELRALMFQAAINAVTEGRIVLLKDNGKIVGCIAPKGFPVPSTWKELNLWS